MNFIGVDLAWGSKNNTGLCIVRDGKVLTSHLAKTDEEILAWLGPVTAGPCVVAIDAPLVVTNPTGRRRCESLISSVFNRSQAGAHSSNLELSAFSKGVRAMELTLRLGLPYDPAIDPGVETRRCLEVYPHPALVALFGLPLTLKYKAKPGRTVASRQAAFAELFRHLESLTAGFPSCEVTTSPRWAHLRDLLETTGSNAVLDRCEDEIDAYVCAYVALYYWTHGLAKCRVVGDLGSGYIVTPVTDALALALDRAADLPAGPVRSASRQRLSRPPWTAPAASSERALSGFCGCGCGSPVRARYLPGHDARHKSALVRAARSGDERARGELVRLGWGRFIGAVDRPTYGG